ncbi:hypothetical protein EJ06DRAFT_1386 [Trichodelitschia bisporula]|uniref:Uncharacterized protein n=1 Tax=Trichodelitschia bisporula TaxID=703511 RepID=A0A6G1I9X2_9PEZI|nr:hypothetical protein EJ06DRAFT_1386 [Trichodelitschia bisporula]
MAQKAYDEHQARPMEYHHAILCRRSYGLVVLVPAVPVPLQPAVLVAPFVIASSLPPPMLFLAPGRWLSTAFCYRDTVQGIPPERTARRPRGLVGCCSAARPAIIRVQ